MPYTIRILTGPTFSVCLFVFCCLGFVVDALWLYFMVTITGSFRYFSGRLPVDATIMVLGFIVFFMGMVMAHRNLFLLVETVNDERRTRPDGR